MRLGIKGKQVLGVTSIVGAVVVSLSVVNLARLASVSFDESQARAELLAKAILHRGNMIVVPGASPYDTLRNDNGLRSIIESSLYSKNVTYAAITDTNGMIVAHSDPSREGSELPPGDPLDQLLAKSAYAQLLAIYTGQGKNYEFRQPLLLGDREIGSIRIGVSTLLIRNDLIASLGPAFFTALAALAIAIMVAMLLAQLLLRPIHVIRSGLTRLGRGEFGVRLDLDQQDEFGELGTFFNAVSEQLSADRSQMAGQVANLESAVEHIEDAVAIVNARGELLFVNPAMRVLLPAASPGVALSDVVAGDHPMQRLSEQTLVSRQSRGPLSATFGDSERLIMTHAINDPKGDLVGIMIIARNVEYLSQVQSTVRYSRKLAALGRLSAGVAHEVKNPLNAMMIHLELLRQQFAARRPATPRLLATAGGPDTAVVESSPKPSIDTPEALQHIDVIASEIRRLDEVVQGFLKFTRPEDLKLQPVALSVLFDEVIPIIQPEADRAGVQLIVESENVPDVNGDPTMLRQAFLNLALNACQAMPNGGTLRVRCESARDRRVAVTFTDTGIGIKPEHLQRIFDLYFTTRDKGSGIGLSMVYRTVQMHDGEIEVPVNTRGGDDVPRPPTASMIAKSPAALIVVTLSLMAAAGCTRAKAKTVPDVPTLDMPVPPPRDIEVNESEPPPPMPLPQEPARNTPLRPRPQPAAPQPARANEPPRNEPPPPVEPAKPAEETPRATAPTLQTTPAQADVEVERQIRAKMTQASTDLSRIDYRALNADARTQYDTAKGFIQQADTALGRKNLEFARTLADKAAALAAQLRGR